MEKTYRSFFLTRLNRHVTEDDLKRLLLGVNSDGEVNTTDEFKIHLYPAPPINTTRNALVFGINLPLREIEARLQGQLVGGSPFFIRYPNFGVQIDKCGNILHSHFETHGRLLDANGFHRPVDIFEDDFVADYGDYPNLKSVGFIRGTKQLWRLWRDTTTDYGVLKYGNTINPFLNDYANLIRSTDHSVRQVAYNTTEIFFATRLQCLQATRKWNRNPAFCAPGVRLLPEFLTGPDMTCQFGDPHMNMGVGNRILNPRDYPFHVVPLKEISRLSPHKVQSFEFDCPICHAVVKVWGVEGDLSWLSGNCHCSLDVMKERGLIHGEETFLRIAKHPLSRRRPVALMQPLMTTYASVEEFISREVPAVEEEFRLDAEELAATHAEFVFNMHYLRETVTLKRKLKDVYVGRAFVPKNNVWCPTGLAKMEKATFHPVTENGHQPIMQPFRGKIFEISNVQRNEELVEIWFEFFIPHGTPFNAAGRFLVSPKAQIGSLDKKIKAYDTWLANEKLCTITYPNFYGTLRKVKMLRRHSAYTRERLCIAEVDLVTSPTTVTIQKHLPAGYVGMNTTIVAEEKGFRMEYHDYARVLEAKDDGWVTTFTIVFPLRESVVLPAVTSFSCKLWAYENPPEPDRVVHKQYILPGMEDDEAEGRDLEEMIHQDIQDDDDDEDDGVLHDGDDLFQYRRRRRGAVAVNQEAEQPLIKIPRTPEEIADSQAYCLSHNLRRPPNHVNTTSLPVKILRSLLTSPIPDVSLGNLLLHEQKITPLSSLRNPASTRKQGRVVELFGKLNNSQTLAVKKFLSYRASITHGPPGTGKSLTAAVGVCILHCTEEGYIIVTAPTNHAADVLFQKILELSEEMCLDMNVVRMVAYSKQRKYSREDPNWQHFLHHQVEMDPDYINSRALAAAGRIQNRNLAEVVVHDNQNVMEALAARQQAAAARGGDHGGVGQGRAERIEERIAQTYYGSRILSKADVIVCTAQLATDPRISGMQKRLFHSNRKLNAVLVDEASFLTVADTIPLLNLGGRRVWLSGDQHQLHCVVKSPAAAIACFNMSWMEKLAMTDIIKSDGLYTLLDVQYRSECVIGQITSFYMYEGKVKPALSVINRKYGDVVKHMFLPELRRGHCVVYTYNHRSEVVEEGDHSKSNPAEVAIVRKLLMHLYDNGSDLNKVSVITMYDAQVNAIRNDLAEFDDLFKAVKVTTIDGSQGRENDIVIVSMVRSNDENKVGFLSHMNRINVATSRAKHFQFVICDMETMRNAREKSIILKLRIWRRFKISVVINHISAAGEVDPVYDADINVYLAATR